MRGNTNGGAKLKKTTATQNVEPTMHRVASLWQRWSTTETNGHEMEFAETEELSGVIREVRAAMGANGVRLIVLSDNGRAPEIILSDQLPSIDNQFDDCLREELTANSDLNSDQHVWFSREASTGRCDVLAIPVQRVPGHSRLVICVIFGALAEQSRQFAADIYLQRRPFAVGYFRLWQLARTLSRRATAFGTALDRADFGVLLLDREGRMVFANEAAQAILVEGDGLRCIKMHLVANSPHDSIRLKTAINQVLSPTEAQLEIYHTPLLMLPRLEKASLVVSVMPTGALTIEPTDIAAIVYVLDPALDIERLLEPICKLYRLSPVETRLVCLLASGAVLSDAAVSMRIKEQSARSYLKQVFLKTDTNRQTDLIRVMLSSLIRATRATPFNVVQ